MIGEFRSNLVHIGALLNTKQYWINQNVFDFLWWNDVPVSNELVDVSGNDNNVAITGSDFTENYIPVGSSATFKMPDVAGLKTDDADLLWFSGLGVQENVTVNNLIESDYSRTVVFYDIIGNIIAIGLLKSTVELTTDLINRLSASFHLWLFWYGVLNLNGYLKFNRTISEVGIVTATVENANKNKVVLTFSEDLNEGSVPDISAFELVGKTITGITVVAKVVTLAVSAAYSFGDLPILNYTNPVANPLQSVTGNKVASIVGQAIVNNIINPYGSELIDQANWYKSTYWNTFGAGWVQDGVTLAKTGAAQFLIKNSFWVIGKTYRVTITINMTAVGTFFAPYNGNVIKHDLVASGTYSYDHVCNVNTSLYMYDQSCDLIITALSIKEVL
jgi:hypothetical protein